MRIVSIYCSRLLSRRVVNSLFLESQSSLRYCHAPSHSRTDFLKKFAVRGFSCSNLLRKQHDEDLAKRESQHDNSEQPPDKKKSKSGQVAQLAKVFAEYGSIGVVFHTTISLTSLGLSYLVVSSGVDVVAIMQKFNLITEVTTEAKVAGGASTLVIAYALHKVFMPVRIFITVSCTPLLVKKLRRIGLLKRPLKAENASKEK